VQIDPQQWSTLSRLLDEALDVPIQALEGWLDSLPPTDAVHRNQLRQLLRQHAAAETGDFLFTLPKVGDPATAEGSAAAGIAPGTVVGPYIVEEEIGRGGMGAVWRARRSDGAIKRPLALKLPHAGPHSQQLIERFARERDILGELSHPNIARLDDAGVTDSGQPFLALEYVPGTQLTDYCDGLRLDVRGRLELYLQVLRAVQYAHGNLVIHRDLKPSNIIVTAEGQAMLLDFGIAKLIPDDAADDCGHTQMGAVALTPEYASPEQITGKPVSTASDIYSLGVLLFELLTGGRPYRLKRTSRAALEEAILSAEPLRPSTAALNGAAAAARGTTQKSLSRMLRGDLDTIALKALKKAPVERYPTVDALARDIEHYLRGEPVSVRADGSWYRLVKFVGRHKLPVAVCTGAALVLIATAAIALIEARSANAGRDRALALSARNEAVTEFIKMLVTESGGADEPVTVSDMMARSQSLVEAEYAGNPDYRAAILAVLGDYYHTIGKDQLGEPLLRNALNSLQGSADPALRIQLMCAHALTVAGEGNIQTAVDALNSALSEPQIDAGQAATCLEFLSYIYQDGADAAKALEYANKAIEKLHQVKHPLASQEGLFLASVGYAHQLGGENDAAERYFSRSIAQFTRVGRDRSPDAISVRNNWAIVSLGAGEPRRALELYDQTLRIVELKNPGSQPPQYLLGNRAHALEALGRYAEARRTYDVCLQKAAGEGPPAMREFCMLGIASVERERGNLAVAEQYLDMTAADINPNVPESFPARGTLHLMRAKVAISRGQFAAAHQELAPVLANGRRGPILLNLSLVSGELNLAENNLLAALDDARRALTLAQRSQGGVPYSNRVGQASLLLARVLARQGATVQAKQAAQTAIDHLTRTVDADHPWLKEARELALSTT
jgi:eukaryotic-like serine/threonine-protein kinase